MYVSNLHVKRSQSSNHRPLHSTWKCKSSHFGESMCTLSYIATFPIFHGYYWKKGYSFRNDWRYWLMTYLIVIHVSFWKKTIMTYTIHSRQYVVFVYTNAQLSCGRGRGSSKVSKHPVCMCIILMTKRWQWFMLTFFHLLLHEGRFILMILMIFIHDNSIFVVMTEQIFHSKDL